MLWFGLKKRIAKLEQEPLAKLITFGKNKKSVLAYDNRVEAIVEFFGERLAKLEGKPGLLPFKCNNSKCGRIYWFEKDFGKGTKSRCGKCDEGILIEIRLTERRGSSGLAEYRRSETRRIEPEVAGSNPAPATSTRSLRVTPAPPTVNLRWPLHLFFVMPGCRCARTSAYSRTS